MNKIEALKWQVQKQLDSNFVFEGADLVEGHFDKAYARLGECLRSFNNNKYISSKVHLQTDFYSTFLYLLANTIFRSEGRNEASDSLFGLNKAFNSIDLFYEVEMPVHFRLSHALGTVLGRASYGDFFSVAQYCTVGNNKGSYPVVGANVSMLMNSAILGNSKIGNNTIISANTTIIDQNIPENSIVFGRSPDLKIVKNNTDRFRSKWVFPLEN